MKKRSGRLNPLMLPFSIKTFSVIQGLKIHGQDAADSGGFFIFTTISDMPVISLKTERNEALEEKPDPKPTGMI